jgi:hypothetical protein
METNLRDTPLRRFATFCWGLGLFVVFGLICLIIKNFIQEDEMFSVDEERGKARVVKREQVEKAQAALLEYKKEGDSVQLPPSALFSVASELEILEIQPADSGIPHNKQFGESADEQTQEKMDPPAEGETPETQTEAQPGSE